MKLKFSEADTDLHNSFRHGSVYRQNIAKYIAVNSICI